MEQIGSILFIDIETVPVVEKFDALPEAMKSHWEKKTKLIRNSGETQSDPAQAFEERSGVYSEFAKVVCIGIGSLTGEGEARNLRLKALTDTDEHKLLTEFSEIVLRCTKKYKDFRFCGHNIKEFDLPFLSRRMIINGLQIPAALQYAGKKPWEVPHIDTMDLWKFGDYKHFTSLALLAEILGLPSPKSDLDGSKVAGVFWQEHDLERIGRYCMQDVLTSARVFLKLIGDFTTIVEPQFVED